MSIKHLFITLVVACMSALSPTVKAEPEGEAPPSDPQAMTYQAVCNSQSHGLRSDWWGPARTTQEAAQADADAHNAANPGWARAPVRGGPLDPNPRNS